MPARLSVLLLLLAPLACLGCGGGSGDVGGAAPAPTGGTLRVSVTDAPFPFGYVESASVVIRQVQVKDASGGWTSVFDGSAEIDLVPLVNGVSELLVETALEPGTYSEVRLIVDAGEVVLGPDAVVAGGDPVFRTDDGRLFFPSGAQTGIKVKISNDIVVTTQLSGDLVLDFDLARSFVFNGPVTHAPGVQRVLFTPVVKAMNSSTNGSLTVQVLSDAATPGDDADDTALEGATVRVLDDAAAVVATGTTGVDGRATFSMEPGTYDLEIEASGHEPGSVTGVSVALANLADAGTVTLAAMGEIGGVVMSDGGTAGDDADDVVVSGATVEIRAAGDVGPALDTTTTNTSGVWLFSGLAPGDYDIAVTATGFHDGALPGVAAELVTSGHTIVLEALLTDLGGTVSGPTGFDPTIVAITATNAAGVQVGSTSPSGDGSWSMTLATGGYQVVFDDGVTQISEDVTIVGADPTGAQLLDAVFP